MNEFENKKNAILMMKKEIEHVKVKKETKVHTTKEKEPISKVKVPKEVKEKEQKEKVKKPKEKINRDDSNNKLNSNLKKKRELPKSTEVETDRKWDDDKNKDLKKGKFDEKEKKKIFDSTCSYMYENGLSIEDLRTILKEKQVKTKESIWTKIASHIPDRSVKSIKDFIARVIDDRNNKGKWSQEETENLITLVNNKGKKWKEIAELLERNPENVKDKYKSIGGDNYLNRSKLFTLIEALKFLKYLAEYSEIDIFKHSYKFRDNSEMNYKIQDNVLVIDKSLKNITSDLIIKNVLRICVDFDALTDFIDEKKQISFTYISDKLKSKSYDDCKNYYNMLTDYFCLSFRSNLKKDIRMFKIIVKEQPDSIEEISFDLIKNGRSEEANKKRFSEIIQLNDIYKIKQFEILINDSFAKLKEELAAINNKQNISKETLDKDAIKEVVKSEENDNFEEYYNNYKKR